MDEKWKFSRFKDRSGGLMMVFLFLWFQSSVLCWSLNREGLALLRLKDRVVSDPFGALLDWNDGDGDSDPCSWFGIECSEGRVVVLNLKDLCLGGTLAPELEDLMHLKSIILRNNSFHGIIPEEIGELKELEVLDLGYNNFGGPLPTKLGKNLSLAILLLDNNELLGILSPEIHELMLLSEVQADENQLSISTKSLSCKILSITWKSAHRVKDASYRRLLQAGPTASAIKNGSAETAVASPSPSPSPSPAPSPSPLSSPSPVKPRSSLSNPPTSTPKKSSGGNQVAMLVAIIGGSVFIFVSIIGIYFYRTSKVATVKPSTSGLSGKLQKAFVSGVPKLKRSELETACEDFSNVIGSSSIGAVYKGTLSSGVEIAVISIAVKTSTDWTKNLEEQFWKKINKLSKMNHKNFVNLLGYCDEEEPFTRMMVFEYAPNGTLFEHLHIKESEHLDWDMRMRIAMGMAYCLEHIHQLNPPISHKNLNSSAVNLTEDYAAKISEFNFWNELAASDMENAAELLPTTSAAPTNNVYNFGVILFEIITGRLPYSAENSSVDDWASHYLRAEEPLKQMVDPTLKFFREEQLGDIGEVIKSCVHPDPKRRPSMTEVAARLRGITGVTLDQAMPKLSPLWREELEVLSAEGT